MTSAVRYEQDGDVGVIYLANAARMNPLSEEMQQGLLELLERIERERSVRAVLLIGEGKSFCVGADLNGMQAAEGDTRSLGQRTADTMMVLSNPLILRLQSMSVPVVSALNGVAAGAGVGLALAADVVIAARSAYFYLPFMPKLGIVPDLGSSWFLTQQLGRVRATALTLLGDRLSAEQAQQWGLIWEVCDDAYLDTQARGLCKRLAALPPHAVVETRAAVAAALVNGLSEQLNYEAQRQRELIDRASFVEGVSAFLARREPVFKAG
ncbi:MAG: enoyl-CoA hydratase/isomerase family protein [Aquabacterium sp.]|uniref:enoyl-CoA hydratase-related protein n=1 Tax=Aquabacterium sp. TaxID=1872578 RepID=UPI0025BAB939|nr:enoyl-CoA hydratase-related protein [Aquabacterium sp.]MBI3381826.1 enoyl-CoA hydratase/isomerase family protein [Aquabacterium sp.]